MLPLSGLQLASRYLAAPGAHDVGGDFYDAVRLDDHITLIVGDVQGKGVEAATSTSLARHTLRAGALAGREPSDLLAQLNNALLYGQAEQLHAGKDPVLRFRPAVVARVDRIATGFSALAWCGSAAAGDRGAGPAHPSTSSRRCTARRDPGPGLRGGALRARDRRQPLILYTDG